MFNTLPYNSFPASTAKFEEGKNDTLQAEIDAIKDGTNIDSFGDVETALSLKVNSADMETALATKTNLSNIAPTFDSESGTYDIGEQVIYEGVLYEFISTHDTPGDWDSTEVQAVKISELIDTLNSNLTNLNDKLVSAQIPYDGTDNIFPVSVRPKMGYQIAQGARNVATGALYLLWYDDSANGFRIGNVLEGNAPSDGDNIVVQYFA